MSNSDILLEFLENNLSAKFCDDCLSIKLKIEPRQQINQICRRLKSHNHVTREKSMCYSYNKMKITNSFQSKESRVPTLKEGNILFVSETHRRLEGIDIEKIRTTIVHICNNLWKKYKKDNAPHSISAVINILKDEDILPRHQANMMLTLCNLRNIYVYEQIKMGQHEINVAKSAWAIVEKWKLLRL